jgi:hypothetical protein
MTVRDIVDYWRDREFLPNEGQEVVFKLGDARLEIKGTTVPEKGPVCVVLAPVPAKAAPAHVKKFTFSLKFEARPVIEAPSVEDARQKALELMEHRTVVDICTGNGDGDFVERQPELLEEVKE